jgi:hypothetical protein
MKTKEQKQKEAFLRQEDRNNRTKEEQVALLNGRPGQAKKERAKLNK